MKTGQQKAKGKMLWVMIVIFLFVSIFGLYVPSDLILSQYLNPPTWLSNVIIVWSLVDIGIIVGIWLWKKWAVYAFAASFILGVLMEVLILTPSNFSDSLFPIFLQILMLVALYRKWLYFK